MTVPVAMASEVLSFVDRLGQRREFDRMVNGARHVVRGLMSIEIAIDEAIEEMPPGVILWTHRDDIETEVEPTRRSWIECMAATLPPEVCQNFVLLPVYRANGR